MPLYIQSQHVCSRFCLFRKLLSLSVESSCFSRWSSLVYFSLPSLVHHSLVYCTRKKPFFASPCSSRFSSQLCWPLWQRLLPLECSKSVPLPGATATALSKLAAILSITTTGVLRRQLLALSALPLIRLPLDLFPGLLPGAGLEARALSSHTRISLL